ncbi:hypothetical protein [Candidatus Deianiraea vastatrix]|uniref:Uncharacterized protein n=1 Tax=Candidatus Deianiraea vastatrix TaxID=2163644 RepID=A0A5B8XEY3_9RICK|nr:hypothetical protein [Candidatus Deianiraea vastatrix]QED23833.1 hypothetical protein Deia_01051 [Candidatus Deianiraea vastatrix]
MTKNLDNFVKAFIRCIGYSAVLALIIMQVGCAGVSNKQALAQNEKAKASLSYGMSKNNLVATRTGALFY